MSQDKWRMMLNASQEKIFPCTNIPSSHFLAGDEAYPSKPYVMRPYPQRNWGPEEELLNKRLRNAR